MTALLAAFLPIAMMILMFSLGLRLSLSEIGAEFRAPRALLAGLAVQMIGLPALAWALGQAALVGPLMLTGLLLVAASPGGVTSNYAALLVRGKVGLSVGMTLITSLAAPITLPLVLLLSGAVAPDGAGLWKISLGMTAVALVPMGLAMGVRTLWSGFATKLARIVDPLAKVLFVLMVLATFVQNWSAMRGAFAEVGLTVMMLAVAGPALAATVGWIVHLSGPDRRTIMTEVSLQNVAITIFVAGKLMGQPELAIPGLIYAVVMNVITLVLIGLTALRAGGLIRQEG
ncbi:bile acid:sodium symporter family protein [Thalassovita sp.]|uniref:bile acid:sodium symporter family protein n=1 Tax=Thalassovita sp. TaxID=1979401 RepID=UPI0029DE8080|nr:bile acid:sodium symporter [Thalassovita sp.]